MELLGPSSHDADVSASQNFLDPPGGSSLPPPSAADSSGDVAAAGASEPPSQQQYFGGVDVDLVADAELRALEAAAAAARVGDGGPYSPEAPTAGAAALLGGGGAANGLAIGGAYGAPPPPAEAPFSPTSPLGRSTGLGSSIGEEISVKTDALIEETLERLRRAPGVQGVVLLDRAGLVLRHTLADAAGMAPDDASAARHASVAQQLLRRAADIVADTCARDDPLAMLQVRTKKHEMLVCSEKGGEFAILVIQTPPAS